MSKASKTHVRVTKRKHNGHAKSLITAKHVAGLGSKPRKLVKRSHTSATSVDELPSFVLIAEEDYFESPEDELDDDDVDELSE